MSGDGMEWENGKMRRLITSEMVGELVEALEEIANKYGYDGMPNDLAMLNIETAQAALNKLNGGSENG